MSPLGECQEPLACDTAPLTFYLGTHHPAWLRTAPPEVALFVSHRRLAGMKTLPKPLYGRSYAVDSGGFTELSMHGKWKTTPDEYVDALLRYDTEITEMDWCAPQDWMCEPFMLDKTGLTVADHQARTVENFAHLTQLWEERAPGRECPIMPVLQGWALGDYMACVDLYDAAGVDLWEYPVVGVGSVCRRQATGQIAEIFRTLAQLDLPLHGFGVKTAGLSRYGRWLSSADSLAWSFQARRSAPLPGCSGHKNCANCMVYALAWRDRVLSTASAADDGPLQLDLWEVDAA